MPKLLVVTASVREGRVGTKVADWFYKEVEKDGRFEAARVDLKELNLSYELPEKLPSTVQNSEYDREEDRKWAQTINEADAVVFVTPEYNHGMPASLKNALDHLGSEWNGKPTSVVGYGSAGAPYSKAAIALVAGWLKLDLISANVSINEVWAAFNEDGSLNYADHYERQAKNILDSLAEKVSSN